VSRLLERLGVELPIVQAGMGGGLAGAELAAAVSAAGGLGTIGILPPDRLARELRAARERTDRPIAVNLILHLTRRAHWDVARDADAVVTFWGRPERLTGGVWIHQCGSVEEAAEAHAAGADGVIAQGREAGGHVRGSTPAAELLAATRRALPEDFPVMSAGGIADARDVAAAIEAGADAAVLGTRFLMTQESGAHALYKQRLVAGRETVLTELFGLGWAGAPHRVLANRATERWLRADPRGPAAVRLANRVAGPLTARVPLRHAAKLAARQVPGIPLLGPGAPTAGDPESLVEAGALYAGESVARITDLPPAGELVAELSAQLHGPNFRPSGAL
jgi:NAD(P)H-dependent flavin oxidoreductase YrpB (nitropropane dioxygenase family)